MFPKDDKTDELFDAILTLSSREDCYLFFEDLCTIPEVREMSRRFHAAKLLSENKVYTDIVSQTGLSSATISRVNRALLYGSGGYAEVIRRLGEKKDKDK